MQRENDPKRSHQPGFERKDQPGTPTQGRQEGRQGQQEGRQGQQHGRPGQQGQGQQGVKNPNRPEEEMEQEDLDNSKGVREDEEFTEGQQKNREQVI